MCMCSALKGSLGVDQVSEKMFAEKLPESLKQREQIQKQQQYQFNKWNLQICTKKADKIFYNGTIYTMEESHPVVQAVAVVKDRIAAVGNLKQIEKIKGPHTRLIDLKNRTLLPGFVEPHIHMSGNTMPNWTQLSPFVLKDMDQVRSKIIQTVQKSQQSQNQWALFKLFDPMITPGTIDVGRKALDQITTKIGIFIKQANGHVGHVNSKAFQLVGITKDSPDPLHGRYIRDSNGQLTGEIQQTAITEFSNRMPKLSGAEYLSSFEKFLSYASSKGCTSLHDCGIGMMGVATDMQVILETFKDPTPVRYSGYLSTAHWDEWMKMKMKPNSTDKQLRINGAKCWVDGSTQAGSAYLKEPYIKPQWGIGAPNYTQQALNKAVLDAHMKGFQVGIHANGDAGIDMALNAFQYAQSKKHRPQLRHRIQHCTVCHKDQLKRMKQLGVSPSFLIGHVYFYGVAFRDRILGYNRAQLIDPMRSAIECGLIPTVHCDYNCQPIDPLRCIFNAVTRIMKQNGQVLNEDQTISPYEAVKTITINAAWQCHMDDIVGSLKKGKFADFVILEQDPMKIDPKQIINISVWQTWKGGQKWYQGQVPLKK